MDQTISEVVYRGRIKDSQRAWKEQISGKEDIGGGTIVASDGNTYKKVDGRLVQVINVKENKKLVHNIEFLSRKLENDGLLNAKSNEQESVEASVAEFVATI